VPNYTYLCDKCGERGPRKRASLLADLIRELWPKPPRLPRRGARR
jgi:hypothetical protein